MTGPPSITQLLIQWGEGNRAALDELTPRVYRELHALARACLRRGRRNQTLQPTELINEVYLRLIDRSQAVQWENRSHFFGIAARLMRMILVDHARARRAAKRGGEADPFTLEETAAFSPGRAPDVLEVDEALSRLAQQDERKAKVIELRYFGGMSREEIADATLDGTRKECLESLVTVPLLIIDDFGMRKLPLTAAEELLELILRCYERASTLVTSNRPVEDWGKLLGDAAAVSAMLDRLLHHGHLLKCGPRSSRTKTDLPAEPAAG